MVNMKDILAILALLLIMFSIIIFIYGFKINKRKVIVFRAKYTLLLNFALILWIIVMISSILEDMNKYRWSLKSSIMIGLFITLGLVLFRVSHINLNIFNASRDIIYNALENALSKYGIDYECRKSNIIIKNSKVFIRVRYTKSTKICTVSLSNIKFPEVLIKVFEDFKNTLNNQESSSKSWLGIFYILISTLTVILGVVFILVLYFLI